MEYLKALLKQRISWWMAGIILILVMLSASFALSVRAFDLNPSFFEFTWGGTIQLVMRCTPGLSVCPCEIGGIQCSCTRNDWKVFMDLAPGGLGSAEDAYCHPQGVPVWYQSTIPVPREVGLIEGASIIASGLDRTMPIYVGTQP